MKGNHRNNTNHNEICYNENFHTVINAFYGIEFSDK